MAGDVQAFYRCGLVLGLAREGDYEAGNAKHQGHSDGSTGSPYQASLYGNRVALQEAASLFHTCAIAQIRRGRVQQRGGWDADLVILPEPEDQRPAMARSREVFPAPLGPTISSRLPAQHLHPHSSPMTLLMPPAQQQLAGSPLLPAGSL